jgi:hypothetical protein
LKASDFEKQYIVESKFEFEGTDGYIKLREPTEDELLELGQGKDDETKITKHILTKLVPACLVEHNFEHDDGTSLGNDEVVTLLKKSGQKINRTIKQWFEAFSDSIEPAAEEKDTKKK